MRHEIAAAAKLAEIRAVHRDRVGRKAGFPEQQPEALGIEGFFFDPALLKPPPEVGVDHLVPGKQRVGKRKFVFGEDDRKRFAGAGAEVKERIVNVHEQCADRHGWFLRKKFFCIVA